MSGRHRATVTAVALALVSGASFVAAASGHHASASARASNAVRVPWVVLEAGPGARSLLIQYRAARCATRPGRARLREGRSAIAIVVRQPVPDTQHARFCSEIGTVTRLRIRLSAPISGRTIVGEGYPWTLGRGSVSYLGKPMQDPPQPEVVLPLVPRVLGLSPPEATRVLSREGFRVKVTGAQGREVTGQDPSRGQLAPGSTPAAPYEGLVTLTTGP